MSEQESKAEKAKHAKEEEKPAWPGVVDPGKDLDEWLAESNQKAEGK